MTIIQEIWKKRSIVYSFAISDLKIRYRNSILGFFWTFLEPLLMLTVLYVVFTNIFKSHIEHFGIYLLLGIIMWNMFSRATEISLTSIIGRSGLVTQIYFPKEIPAISSTITASLMMCFEIIVFGIFMVVFNFAPPITIIYLPLVLFLEFLLALGIALPLSVLNVHYRDVQFIWKIVLQVGFFLTPVFYKLDVLPQTAQNLLKYSPIVQILNMAHDVTIYNTIPSHESIAIALITTILVFVCGYILFRKAEKQVIENL